MTPELEDIVERLEKIEKQIADAGLDTEQATSGRTVVAQKFVVRDAQGTRRVELGMMIPEGQTEGWPWLGLFDENENVRACMGTRVRKDIDGPWLELYGANQQVAVEITAGENGPTVRLFDANGKGSVMATVSELGPCLVISDPNGEGRLSLHIVSGKPWLVMDDATGHTVLKLAVDSGGPFLMFAKDNKVFWSAP